MNYCLHINRIVQFVDSVVFSDVIRSYLFTATAIALVEHPDWHPQNYSENHEPSQRQAPVRIHVIAIEECQWFILDDLE